MEWFGNDQQGLLMVDGEQTFPYFSDLVCNDIAPSAKNA